MQQGRVSPALPEGRCGLRLRHRIAAGVLFVLDQVGQALGGRLVDRDAVNAGRAPRGRIDVDNAPIQAHVALGHFEMGRPEGAAGFTWAMNNLLFITFGNVSGGGPPILSQQLTAYSNPLPHVLILTAIVVGVATTAVGLAQIVRIYEAYGTADEDEIDAMDNADDKPVV